MTKFYMDGVLDERERIIRLIKKDIEFQSSKLKHDFESDKAIEWRLTGMRFMIEKIKQDANCTKDEEVKE